MLRSIATGTGSAAVLLALAVPVQSDDTCSCLSEYVDQSSRAVTPELMQEMADRFGREDAEASAFFSTDNDMGGPYSFEWPTGPFVVEMNGGTSEWSGRTTLSLRYIRSREQIENDELLMQDLDLEPGESILRDLAESALTMWHDEAPVQIEGPGDFVLLSSDESELYLACGDALMHVTVNQNIPGEPVDPDQPGIDADGRTVLGHFAGQLLTGCD